jgi:hypothetical protein
MLDRWFGHHPEGDGGVESPRQHNDRAACLFPRVGHVGFAIRTPMETVFCSIVLFLTAGKDRKRAQAVVRAPEGISVTVFVEAALDQALGVGPYDLQP